MQRAQTWGVDGAAVFGSVFSPHELRCDSGPQHPQHQITGLEGVGEGANWVSEGGGGEAGEDGSGNPNLHIPK